MPDLNDSLRALLHERADDAPAVPAPTAALVRTVRRRQAVRTGLAVGGAALGVVAVVAVAVVAVRPDARVAPPVAQQTTPASDKYEFCTGPVYDQIVVSVHPTELKFGYGCYRVHAGATSVTFTNPQRVAHNLVITPESGGVPVITTKTIVATAFDAYLLRPLTAGDYTLTCTIHPSMHAQLVVR